MQVLCDVIQSGGVIGNPYLSPQEQLKKPIEVVFCNPDLLWRGGFERPRLGQGAFKEAFLAIYKVTLALSVKEKTRTISNNYRR